MKRMILILSILCLFLFSDFSVALQTSGGEEADQSGVQFEKIPIPDAMEKAGNENKLILIDFFSDT